MKKLLHILAVSLFLGFLGGCADDSSMIVQQINPDEMYHHASITSFQKLSSDNDQYIIYFNSGDTIPLQLTLNNDFVESESQTIYLTAKRTIYFMIRDLEQIPQENSYHVTQNSSIYISFDAIQWVPIHDIEELKKLSGVEADNVTFGFRVSDDEGVTSQLVIDSY